MALLFFENLIVEISHALFLSANVEGPIAANGKEPFGRRGIGLATFVSFKLHKGFLDDITGPVAIAEDARGVLQEGQLEATHEAASGHLSAGDWFGHAHKLFTVLTRQPPIY